MRKDLLTASKDLAVNSELKVTSEIVGWQIRTIEMLVNIAFMDLSQPGGKEQMTREIEHLRVLGGRIEEARNAFLQVPFEDTRVNSETFRR